MATGVGMSSETEMLIAESCMFPGFKFTPTDEELISFYLKSKIEGSDGTVQIIPEVDLCKFEPWDLPAKSVIKSDTEWFFFSSRGRKYPNGSQSKRATEAGYWKATGKARDVKSGSCLIGKKRTLVFHMGRAPRGERTEWIIHEFSMHSQSQDSLVVFRLKKNLEFHVSDKSNPNSPNQQSASASKYGHSTACEAGIDPMASGDKAGGDGSLKNCSSSYDPRSSDQADDCFADVMKNDIVFLEDSYLWGSKQAMPSQGTANRRIRLRMKGTLRSHGQLRAAGLKAREETETFAEVWSLKGQSVFTGRMYMLLMFFLAVLFLFLGMFVC